MPRPALSKISTASLSAELARRQRAIPTLQKRRATLHARVRALEAQIAALGGANEAAAEPPGKPRRQREGKLTLAEALAAVLKAKTMSVTEAVAAVRAAGYETKAKKFYHAVAGTLARSGGFTRVGRGKYKAK